MPIQQQVYESPGPWFSFVIFLVGIVVAGVFLDSWLFLCLPFAYLGLACSAANFNLADGCLVIVVSIIGGVIALIEQKIGVTIVTGVIVGWVLGCTERSIRVRPVPVFNKHNLSELPETDQSNRET
ncbi:MAG: hypothetical protein JXM70_02145 [Pirellulales bacterium]|nr:hypothetical protein [Pirellulales bacterium]